MKDWKEITTFSEIVAVEELRSSYNAGDFEDVGIGLNELLDSMARSEQRALESQLIRLMMHVIKWKIQPAKRSKSWLLTIKNARFEIAKIKKYAPSLNDNFILSIWDEAFVEAKEEAEIETEIKLDFLENLTTKEVFEEIYGFEE